MTIFLKKFGTTLGSRQLGREAFAAFKPSLDGIKDSEKVVVDFDGVVVLTSSWGDEFLSPLLKMFRDRLVLKNTSNLSVKATLKLLEEIHKVNFAIE